MAAGICTHPCPCPCFIPWCTHSFPVSSLPPPHPIFQTSFSLNNSWPCPGIYPAEIRLLITVFYDFLFIIALRALCSSAFICILRNHFLRHCVLNGKGKKGFQNTEMGSLAPNKGGTCSSIRTTNACTTNAPFLLLLSLSHQGCHIHSASWQHSPAVA